MLFTEARVLRLLDKSPVTGGRTAVVDAFDPRAIERRYRNMGIDVARYYDGMKRVELRQCLDTGYRFFCPLSLAGEADFYDQMLGDDATDYRAWSSDFQFASDRIEDGETVLDIGCGYGKFLSRIAGRAVGVDGNGKARDRCVEAGLDVRPSIPDAQFDVVTAFHVLEHVWNVRSFLAAAIAAVRPGGRLIVAVPNCDPWFLRFDKYDTLNTPPHHVGLWSKSALLSLAPHFGLEVVEHVYLDTSRRPLVQAYLRAKLWAGVKTEIHRHSFAEKARIGLLLAPALAAGVVAPEVAAANVIVYRKPHVRSP